MQTMTNVVRSLANTAQCTRVSHSSASAKRIEMERTLFYFLVAVVSHGGEKKDGENWRSNFCVARTDGGKLEKLIFSSARLISYFCAIVSSLFIQCANTQTFQAFYNAINK